VPIAARKTQRSPGTQAAEWVRVSRTLGSIFAAGASLVALGCGGTVTDAPDSAPTTAARDSSAVDEAIDADSDASGPAACVAAGGQCLFGAGTNCAKVGPQDCNTFGPNSGGNFCCLALLPDDAESDSTTEPDAGSGGNECTSAGGQCLIGDVICAVPGPQSCGGVTPAGYYCCLSNAADCGQPDATTFECPEPDGGASCQGGPPVPFGAPNYEALQQAVDEDASYPAGCRVTFPACNNGKVSYCTCSGGGPGFSGWSCFQNEGN
jgi:hypothetical protein